MVDDVVLSSVEDRLPSVMMLDNGGEDTDTAHEDLPAAPGIGGTGALMVGGHSCRIIDDTLSSRMGGRPPSATLLLEDGDDDEAHDDEAHDEFLPAATRIGGALVGRHSPFPSRI